MPSPVCVYPAMVSVAADVLAGSGVHLASVATAFPSGQAPLEVKLDGEEYLILSEKDILAVLD